MDHIDWKRMDEGGHARHRQLRAGKVHWQRIMCPMVLDVTEPADRGPSIEFLRKIDQRFVGPTSGLILDFSLLQRPMPAGALLLKAHVQRLARNPASSMRLTCRPATKNGNPDQVLQQLSIYDDLGHNSTTVPKHQTVTHWHHATGVHSEGVKGGTILEAYEGRIPEALTKNLYSGFCEAMTNTGHHAYPAGDGDSLKRHMGKRWWLLSQELDGRLFIAFCDLGIGIPRSLPKSKSFTPQAVRQAFAKLGLRGSDENAILVALELGKSSTGLRHRGKGLSEIVDVVNLSPNGRVFISSKRGVVVSSEGRQESSNHSHSIDGTLIWWSVDIKEQSAGDGDEGD